MTMLELRAQIYHRHPRATAKPLSLEEPAKAGVSKDGPQRSRRFLHFGLLRAKAGARENRLTQAAPDGR
jgi:hypothetical protein